MAPKTGKEKLNDLEELMETAMAMLEALSAILIETGYLDKGAFTAEVNQIRARYAKLRKEYGDMAFLFETEFMATAYHTYRCLPKGMELVEGRLAIADSESASEICGVCIMQTTFVSPSGDVLDACGLVPAIQKRKRKGGRLNFNGINPQCWMMVAAGTIMEALNKDLFDISETAAIMAETANQIDMAVKQHISTDGILNIIACAVVTERIREDDAECVLDVNDSSGDEKIRKKEHDEGLMDEVLWHE